MAGAPAEGDRSIVLTLGLPPASTESLVWMARVTRRDYSGVSKRPAADFRRNRTEPGAVPSVHDLNRGAEDVARATLRDDELGLCRVSFDFPPQPKHLNVDGAIIDFVVVYAARLEELIPAEDSFRSDQ